MESTEIRWSDFNHKINPLQPNQIKGLQRKDPISVLKDFIRNNESRLLVIRGTAIFITPLYVSGFSDGYTGQSLFYQISYIFGFDIANKLYSYSGYEEEYKAVIEWLIWSAGYKKSVQDKINER